MDYYEITTDVYRISGGFGKDGQNFGGIVIIDNPSFLIGCSGRHKFKDNLKKILSTFGIEKLDIILSSITYEELLTLDICKDAGLINRVYVYETISQEVSEPREYHIKNRYFNDESLKGIARSLPKSVENVVSFSKNESISGKKYKILTLPFEGPHKGHVFIYSVQHKLLFAGLFLGMSATNPNLIYFDKSASFTAYTKGLEFLKQAQLNILVSSYDEVKLLSKPVNIENILNLLEQEQTVVLDLIKDKYVNSIDLTKQYLNQFVSPIKNPPYDEIKLYKTKFQIILNELKNNGSITTDGNDNWMKLKK
ncbi:MAG: hypothetical protein OEY49_11750 [Candidatus Heimdallarchaeota archaeon]|nr:hypothetical protein [Candidatus Heimdallarchaeota archaeon]